MYMTQREKAMEAARTAGYNGYHPNYSCTVPEAYSEPALQEAYKNGQRQAAEERHFRYAGY